MITQKPIAHPQFWQLLTNQIRYDLQIKYVGSVAGVYWAVFNPLIQVTVYAFLMTVVAHARFGTTASSGRFDTVIYMLSAMCAWLAMQEGLMGSATAITKNATIVKNVIFPLEILPISAVLTSLVSMLVSLTALFILIIISHKPLGISLLALPVLLLIQLIFTIGIGYYFAIVTTFLRDIAQILPVLLQLFMLLMPIVYPATAVPAKLRIIAHYNLVFIIVDGYRQVLYHALWPNWASLAVVSLFALFLFVSGLLLFRRVKGFFEGVI